MARKTKNSDAPPAIPDSPEAAESAEDTDQVVVGSAAAPESGEPDDEGAEVYVKLIKHLKWTPPITHTVLMPSGEKTVAKDFTLWPDRPKALPANVASQMLERWPDRIRKMTPGEVRELLADG